jgi:hypothetical protein
VPDTTPRPFVCQHRQPTPCPVGFHWFSDAQGTEGGPSCVSIIATPSSVEAARSTCASYAASASSPVGTATDDYSDPMALPYWHLATFAR